MRSMRTHIPSILLGAVIGCSLLSMIQNFEMAVMMQVYDEDQISLESIVDNESDTDTALSRTRLDSDNNTITQTVTSAKTKSVLQELIELTGDNVTLECPFPLVPFHDVVKEDTFTAGTSKIPSVLHLSMKSRCLPQDLVDIFEQWKKQFPDHSIFFHDNDAVDKLINKHNWPEFPDLQRVMPCVKPGAMTIDIWRVLVLHKYGGMYSDIDNWAQDTFTKELIPDDVSFFSFSDVASRTSQWFLASEPNTPLTYLAMKLILQNVLQLKTIHDPRVVYVTGPVAFMQAYESFLHSEKQNPYKGDGNYTGMFEMKVKKIPWKETPYYILPKKTYADIVQSHFNATKNMTRAERIDEETGVMHWAKAIFKTKKTTSRRGSCKKLLTQLKAAE